MQSILDTFKDDFYNYSAHSDTVRLHRVFARIARFLNQKVKYSNIDPEEQSRDTKRILQLLTQANLVTPVYHSHSNGIPLAAEMDLSSFKLLFLDVGLVNRMLNLRWNEKKSPLAIRFDLNPPSIQSISHHVTDSSSSKPKSKPEVKKVDFKLISLPLYAVDELPRIISESALEMDIS